VRPFWAYAGYFGINNVGPLTTPKESIMATSSIRALQVVLVLAGAFTTFTGINIAFGGIATLGWQGVANFFAITNEHAFLVQDSHIRFLGGVWIAVGLLLSIAPTNLRRFEDALYFVFVAILLGGLARLGQMSPDVTFGVDIVGSWIAEVVGMPILIFWLRCALRTDPRSVDTLERPILRA
jgi:hypothetical protein